MRKTKLTIFLAVISLTFFGMAGVASAAEYYVSPTLGSNSDCTAIQNVSTPAQTIAFALSCLSGAGNSVRLLPGNYSAFAVTGPVPSGAVGNENVIRSDDGAGNYARDQVVVSGVITGATKPVTVFTRGVSNWKFEQFSISVSNNVQYGFLSYDPGTTRSNVQVIGLKVSGALLFVSEQSAAIGFINTNNIVVDGCTIDTTNSTALVDSTSDTAFANTTGGYIANNNLSGQSDQYVIGFKRYWDINVYNNYIHDWIEDGYTDDTDSVFFVRHGGRINIYNNIIKRGSGGYIQIVATLRGMSNLPTPPGATDVKIYNNTIDYDGGTPQKVFFGGDHTLNNEFTNNLITDCASVPKFYDEWTGYLAENQVMRSNKVECDVVNWNYAGGGVDGGDNTDNVSVPMQKTGNIPSPYYQLTASLDGYAFSTQPIRDYDGYSRQAYPVAPDAGAFEYVSSVLDTTPPSSPSGLVVN